MKKTRRQFIQTTTLAGAALVMRPVPVFSSGMPSDKIIVAVMGVRSRGLLLAQNFAQMPGTEVGCICDVDEQYLGKCIEEVSKLQTRRPSGEKDIRKVLENKDIDAIAIAAPDHWHAPAAILSVQSGKHVYLEKPCSHNPREGELLIEAEKKYGRIIHMGNQRRSWRNIIQCMEELRQGIIGRVYFAKGWYANNRLTIGKGKPVPVPAWLDWDLWQGPAPRRPYHDNVHPYNWHWFWHWGTGEALNNGTHEIDVMRWGLGVDYPARVVAAGGRYHFHDDWEFPDTMVLSFDFPGGKSITWESRSCNAHPVESDGRGVIFYGESGTVVVTGNGYTVYSNDNPPVMLREVRENNTAVASTNTSSPDASLDGVHIKNFLDGIRNGVPTSSPIAEGHKSVLLCQLGNIAWKTGRALNINPDNGRIVGDKKAMKYWEREYERNWQPLL